MEKGNRRKALVFWALLVAGLFMATVVGPVAAYDSTLKTTVNTPVASNNYSANFVANVTTANNSILNMSLQYYSSGSWSTACSNTTGDGNWNETWTCTVDVSTISDGPYTFRGHVENASATNNSVNITLVGIDDTNPSLSSVTAALSSLYSDESQTINVTCSDTGFSNCLYVEYNDPYNGTFNLTNLGSGSWGKVFDPVDARSHNWRLRAWDFVGQNSGWTSVRVFDVLASSSTDPTPRDKQQRAEAVQQQAPGVGGQVAGQAQQQSRNTALFVVVIIVVVIVAILGIALSAPRAKRKRG